MKNSPTFNNKSHQLTKYINRHFAKVIIWMANKHTKSCQSLASSKSNRTNSIHCQGLWLEILPSSCISALKIHSSSGLCLCVQSHSSFFLKGSTCLQSIISVSLFPVFVHFSPSHSVYLPNIQKDFVGLLCLSQESTQLDKRILFRSFLVG